MIGGVINKTGATDVLGIYDILHNNSNNNNICRVKVFMVPVIRRQGVTESVQWLAKIGA